jgi:hypothetical protein
LEGEMTVLEYYCYRHNYFMINQGWNALSTLTYYAYRIRWQISTHIETNLTSSGRICKNPKCRPIRKNYQNPRMWLVQGCCACSKTPSIAVPCENLPTLGRIWIENQIH